MVVAQWLGLLALIVALLAWIGAPCTPGFLAFAALLSLVLLLGGYLVRWAARPWHY